MSLFAFPVSLQAQKFELGIGGGAMHYRGDLAPTPAPRFARLGGHVFARHNPGKAVSFRYGFAFGKIFADDAQVQDQYANQRGRFFNTRIAELSAVIEYNFLDYRSENSRRAWTPYLFGGVAGFRFYPQENTDPDYRTTQIGIPFGVGAKFVLGGQWNLGLEFGARKTFTDYLDDLGGDIDRTNKFRNGVPDDNDMYFYTALSISYTFYKIRCPDFY